MVARGFFLVSVYGVNLQTLVTHNFCFREGLDRKMAFCYKVKLTAFAFSIEAALVSSSIQLRSGSRPSKASLMYLIISIVCRKRGANKNVLTSGAME